MEDLPNGFITRPKKTPGFESAGDAIRRSRLETRNRPVREDFSQAQRQALEDGWKLRRNDYEPHPSTEHSMGQIHSKWGDDLSHAGIDVRSYLHNVENEEGVVDLRFDLEELDNITDTQRRWSWVEVDREAITNNVLSIRQTLHPDTLFMAVVKADGYGHGSIEATKAAIAGGASYAGVATVDEGIKIRKAGIDIPILILSEPPLATIPLLLAYDIMPSIASMEFAVKYAEAADSIGARAHFHLKVNTGMNRIGVRYDEVGDFLRTISFHRALLLVGTFTHFATADADDTMDFNLQKHRFDSALNEIRSAGFDPGIVHAANSAATLRYKDVQYDMVRPGLAMYGCYPCPESYGKANLMPAMSVKARITQVNQVPVGEGVSYGLLHRSSGYAKTCTIPIGYGDGLKRGLSGRIDFIYGGRMFPQVGNICMDQCMFEIDQRMHPGVGRIEPNIGDEVVVVGSEGNCFITVDQMAELIHTIPYEIMIGFGDSRLPRVYV